MRRDTGVARPERTRVLHVVEALGGGVLSAMRDHLASTPELDHVVLARERPRDGTGESFAGLAQAVIVAPDRLGHAIVTVNRAYARYEPHIVHAHSSLGGAWVRLSRVPRGRIVYTPHCYAFEREDLSTPTRVAYREIEALLARRTAHVAGVALREVELARSLSRRQTASHVPNVVRIPDQFRQEPEPRLSDPPVVVGAGRLRPQKDPLFFAEVARHILAADPGFRVCWLGGGDDEYEATLRAAGVEVTGWLDRIQVLERMAGADIYLHTAAWEGAPVTVLEAAAVGLPTVGRRIAPLASMGLRSLYDRPSDVANAVVAMRDPATYAAARAQAAALDARHQPQAQRAALLDVYAQVARRPVTPGPARDHHREEVL